MSESVTQQQFFEVMRQIQEAQDDQHARLRETLEKGLDRLHTDLKPIADLAHANAAAVAVLHERTTPAYGKQAGLSAGVASALVMGWELARHYLMGGGK